MNKVTLSVMVAFGVIVVGLSVLASLVPSDVMEEHTSLLLLCILSVSWVCSLAMVQALSWSR